MIFAATAISDRTQSHSKELSRKVLACGLIGLTAMTHFAASSVAMGEKMDSEIHSLVIQKLETVLKQTHEDQNVSLKPVRARLADLYAERARLRSMDEAARNCTDCKGALDDRRRALAMYKTVLEETSKETRGPMMLQMAQLHELNNEPTAASQLDEKIIAEGLSKHSKKVVAEALVGRAETRFGAGDLDHAQIDFESALKLVDDYRRGPILHRIAWCELNKGQQVVAARTLVHILETPELLMTDSTNRSEVDLPFQEDVARDLATFFARGEVSHREIALLESLSPERAKKDILKHFAGECERLGQKKAAIETWAIVAKYESNSSDRLEALVRLAQIRFDLGERKEALAGLREAVDFWKKSGCESEKSTGDACTVLAERVRALVLSWNRLEKKQPSALLLEAYLAYLSLFDKDMEMTEWAAEVARTQKQFATAASLFHRASILAASSKAKDSREILESSLVGEVEMAERSKDINTREASYDHYLQLNPSGAMAPKIRYQRAHVAYERGNMMNEASGRFHEFATSNDCLKPKSVQLNGEVAGLCVQAADLDLDALAGISDHALVESRAAEYARVYPQRQSEYLKISRTSVLKQAEISSQNRQPQLAIAKLATVNLAGASGDEKVRVYKMRLALAEQSHDLLEVARSAQLLLSVKGLSTADRELALGKLEWAAEMNLDFVHAFQMAKIMKLSQFSPENRTMKLALLAELSGNDPSTYEKDYLRLSHDEEQKAQIEAKLVRDSKHPEIEYGKFESSLRRHPGILAPLALEIYVRTQNAGLAMRQLKVRGVSQDTAGQLLDEALFLKDFSPRERTLAHHRLSSSSDALIKRSMSERIHLLQVVGGDANRAISSRDWALQLIVLTTLARENIRLYNDVIALPAPKKLKGPQFQNQLQKYHQMVADGVRGYLQRSDEITRKLNVLWSDSNSQSRMTAALNSARPEFRPMLSSIVGRLAEIAPAGVKPELRNEMAKSNALPTEREVLAAREQAKASPFDPSTLQKLRNLEEGRGRETMVAYLDARLLKLKTGDRQ